MERVVVLYLLLADALSENLQNPQKKPIECYVTLYHYTSQSSKQDRKRSDMDARKTSMYGLC